MVVADTNNEGPVPFPNRAPDMAMAMTLAVHVPCRPWPQAMALPWQLTDRQQPVRSGGLLLACCSDQYPLLFILCVVDGEVL